MSRIHHSPLTGYIDLDKIARISDAKVVFGRLAPTGVRCVIDIQLRDAPIEYMRPLANDEDTFSLTEGYRVILTDGSLIDSDNDFTTPHSDYLCVARLQAQIDELVAAWKGD